MDSLLLTFGTIKLDWQMALLSFLLAFILSSLIAQVYEWTFQGVSWSRGLMQAMVLGSMVSCLLMIAIGDNVARGIGIVGSLAVIRFRTNLRDPRDLVFLFAALGVGVASGVQSYMTAIIGAIMFCLVAATLLRTPFGSGHSFDGLVRFQLPSRPEASARVAEIMQKIPKGFTLVTQRNVAQGDLVDCAYQIKLSREEDRSELMSALQAIDGIRGVTYMNQQTTVEI